MIKEFIITENLHGLLGGRLSFKTNKGDTLTTENLPKELINNLEIILKAYVNEEYKNLIENKKVDLEDSKILKLFVG